MINIEGIGERIKALRTKAKMTQIELAKKLQITRRETIYSWEKGKVIPSIWDLKELCEIFQCDITYLLGEHECKTRKATDIQKTTGLSEEAITVLIQLKAYEPTLVFLNELIAGINSAEISGFPEAFLSYIIDTHIESFWQKENPPQKAKRDDNTSSYEYHGMVPDFESIDFQEFHLTKSFNRLIEYFLRTPQFKERVKEIYEYKQKRDKGFYHKYKMKQYELLYKGTTGDSEPFYAADSYTVSLLFNEGKGEE